MILEPDGLRKAAPGKGELVLKVAGNGYVITSGARPGFVTVLFQILSLGLNDGKDGLGGTESGNALEHGDRLDGVDRSLFQAEANGSIAHRGHERGRGGSKQAALGKPVSPLLSDFAY